MKKSKTLQKNSDSKPVSKETKELAKMVAKALKLGLNAMEENHGATMGGPYEEASEQEVIFVRRIYTNFSKWIKTL